MKLKKRKLQLRILDASGNMVKAIVRYDNLSRAKKPPAWMNELLFSKDTSGGDIAG